MYVIQVVGLADGTDTPHDGRYVTEIDVDAWDGRGMLYTINNAEEALGFESYADAFEYWRQQSAVRPLRPDGKPNRPGTAFTVEIFRDAR